MAPPLAVGPEARVLRPRGAQAMSAVGKLLAVVAGLVGSLAAVAYLAGTFVGWDFYGVPPSEWLLVGVAAVVLAVAGWVAL